MAKRRSAAPAPKNGAASPRRSERKGSGGPGPGSRSQRSQQERARRRRRNRRRVGLLVAVAVLAAAVAAFLLTREGAPTAGPSGATTTSTSAPAGEPAAYTVRVTEGTEAPIVAVVIPDGEPTAIVTMPGRTLVKGPEGFEPLAPLLAAEDPSAGLAGLEDLLGSRPRTVATVSWAALRAALATAQVTGEWPETVKAGGYEEAESVARALAALGSSEAGRSALEDMEMTGDASGLRAALRSLSAGAEVVAALPGKAVEGTDFAYYAPDAAAIAALLGHSAVDGGISIEVQNGSGAVGIAQKVGAVLVPLGHQILPPKNADDFPDVELTRIYAAPDALAQAERARTLLAVGTVVRQESLPPGRIVVVVGKDLKAESLGAGG